MQLKLSLALFCLLMVSLIVSGLALGNLVAIETEMSGNELAIVYLGTIATLMLFGWIKSSSFQPRAFYKSLFGIIFTAFMVVVIAGIGYLAIWIGITSDWLPVFMPAIRRLLIDGLAVINAISLFGSLFVFLFEPRMNNHRR